MSRRRRPHPARRARRAVGMSALGVYAGLAATIGWAQRDAEADTTPDPAPPDEASTLSGVERLDLSAAASLRASHESSRGPATPMVAPTPPPPPSLAATTTTTPRATTPPTTRAVAAPTTAPPQPPPAAPTTTVAPPTTTSIAPPTTPPPTSLPTGGS